ncbi:hypothetical protein CEXT_220521 [Caerostris extrusa]|uniref:Uncharacterized protein n=1 Tax=Caerostris extrusa TaxID=172846 RepID=A0AAV4NPM5_CAEEX|nr:hypothetical protein CEXT_220521 [Caerostris extrusa]
MLLVSSDKIRSPQTPPPVYKAINTPPTDRKITLSEEAPRRRKKKLAINDMILEVSIIIWRALRPKGLRRKMCVLEIFKFRFLSYLMRDLLIG